MFKIEMNVFGTVKCVKDTWLFEREFQSFKTENAAQKKIEQMRFYVDSEVLKTAMIVKIND